MFSHLVASKLGKGLIPNDGLAPQTRTYNIVSSNNIIHNLQDTRWGKKNNLATSFTDINNSLICSSSHLSILGTASAAVGFSGIP